MKSKFYFKSALSIVIAFMQYANVIAQFSYFAGTGAGSGFAGYTSTAVGAYSLSNGSSGNGLAAIGYLAMQNNTTGEGNTALGTITLQANTIGSYNAATGLYALSHNTSGNKNTSNGSFSLYLNISGYNNSAFGAAALYNNTGGYENSAFGDSTLYNNKRSGNSAFGSSSLFANTNGGDDNAFGYHSLYSNDSGSANCAFGSYTLFLNRKGNENSAFGNGVLYYNTTGYDNSAFGNHALLGNTTGYQNTGIGDYANDANTTGFNNTSVGSNALHLNNTGSNNTAIGRNAGGTKTIYNKCTFLGTNADASASGKTNATAIGYGATVTGSNKVQVGNASVTSIGGQVGWTTLSDLRLKENIKDSKLGLDFILRLHPVTYNYKEEGQRDILYTGLIAQEVDAAAKRENVEFSGVDKNGEYWGIRYGDLTVPLIKSVQEINSENKNQTSEIENLKKENKALKSTMIQMQECLNSLCQNQQKLNSNDASSSPQLLVSPNPSHGIATISISGNDRQQNLIVKISDASGKTIHTFNSKSSTEKFELNTSSMSAGSYLIQLFNQNKIIQTEKLIVQ